MTEQTDSQMREAPGNTTIQPIAPNGATAIDSFTELQSISASKKKHRGRTVAILVGCVVLLLVAFALVIPLLLPPAAPETVGVSKGTFQDVVNGKGAIEPANASVASSQVDGTVSEVMVGEGSVVNVGDVLYTIDNPDLDVSVTQAKAALDQANNQVSEAANQLEVARVTPSIAEALDADGNPVRVDSTGTQIANAQLALATANSNAASAQSAYDAAVAKADQRTVRAGTAGTVLVNNLVPGTSLATLVQAGTVPMRIGDMSKLEVKVDVNEADIAKIAEGQSVDITFDAIAGLTQKGTVKSVADASKAATTTNSTDASQASTGVRFRVTIEITDPDPGLKSGMTAHVAITTQTIDDTLLVPVVALNDDAKDGTYVNRYRADGTTEMVPVTVKATGTTDVAVDGDLSAGDRLLLSSVSGSTSDSTSSTTIEIG